MPLSEEKINELLINSLIDENILRANEKKFALNIIREYGDAVFEAFIAERIRQIAEVSQPSAQESRNED